MQVRLGQQLYTYADPNKALEAAQQLEKLADQYEAKVRELRTIARMLREQRDVFLEQKRAKERVAARERYHREKGNT